MNPKTVNPKFMNGRQLRGKMVGSGNDMGA